VAIRVEIEPNSNLPNKGQNGVVIWKWLTKNEKTKKGKRSRLLDTCAEKSNEQIELLKWGKTDYGKQEYWTELPQ